VNISWPAGYTNLYLQFSTNLAVTNWTTLTNLPSATNGSSYVLSVNPSNTTRPRSFFRLIGITNLSQTNLLFPTITNTVIDPIIDPS
jgi:hypothetical protein